MTRNPFGWDLPPGVTQRMIDESVGGDDPTEELNDIEDQIEEIHQKIIVLNAQLEELKRKLIDIIGGERD